MSLWESITKLVKDPPPAHVFELSEAGLAHASSAHSSAVDTGFAPLPEGALEVSPVENNVRSAEAILPVLGLISAPKLGGGKPGAQSAAKRRRTAAVLLPDACARVSILDFDGFPTAPAEQLALVRFRVKKTIPFDIDSATVGYFVQSHAAKGKTDVVAVTIALEVLARYEALFRSAGFHPGDITVSSLAVLNLYKGQEPTMLAKLAANTLTVMVAASGKLRLFRCVTLEQGNPGQTSLDEIRSILFPTFAYAEDELGAPIRRVLLCGFDEPLEGLPCKSEPMRGRFGPANPFNAGLIGYLEGTSL